MAWTPLLCLASGCVAERLSAPIAEPLSAAAPAQSQIVRKDAARIGELSSDDIENIEIIKGPASQLSAASGCTAVIIVTTKPRRLAQRAP